MDILKLKKPIKIDGEEKAEIEYDFEELTGNDVENVVRELQNSGIMITTLEFDTTYHAAIFAKAAGIAYEDVRRFYAKDFTKAATLARNFFLADLAEE